MTKNIIKSDAFNRKYFQTGNYEDYKKNALIWTGRVTRQIMNMVRDPSPRVLDVGCAYGYLLVALQEAGCRVSGLEYSQYAIKKAEPAVRQSIQEGSVLEDQFRKNEFDVVICLNVLEYIPEAQVGWALSHLVNWTNNLIIFTTCFTHSRYSSQKHSPDPLRLTIKTEKEWIALFRRVGAKHYKTFYDGGGGDVLVLQKNLPSGV